MPNMTLALPEDIHERMKKHTEVRWSEIARRAIVRQLDDMEAVERIARKSKLTKKDVNDIARLIDRDVAKELGLR